MKKFIMSLMVFASVFTFASCKEESSADKAGSATEAAAGDAEGEMKKAEDAAKDVKVPEAPKAPELK